MNHHGWLANGKTISMYNGIKDKCIGWKKNVKRAYVQGNFRKHHTTIDHLVTLQVLTEESLLRGKGLYCCFVDFKKAFDMVPCEYLSRKMEELEVPSEYMLAISPIYERVICCVCMSDVLSKFFNSNVGVKQGCPLLPTLFGLCID